MALNRLRENWYIIRNETFIGWGQGYILSRSVYMLSDIFISWMPSDKQPAQNANQGMSWIKSALIISQSSILLGGTLYGFGKGIYKALTIQPPLRIHIHPMQIRHEDLPEVLFGLQMQAGIVRSQQQLGPRVQTDHYPVIVANVPETYPSADDEKSTQYAHRLFQPVIKKTFIMRLQAIDYPMDQIPEFFLDPIEMTLMENPVLYSGKIFDLDNLNKWFKTPRMLYGIRVAPLDPVTQKPVTPGQINAERVMSIRSAIEQFVTEEEKKHADKRLENQGTLSMQAEKLKIA